MYNCINKRHAQFFLIYDKLRGTFLFCSVFLFRMMKIMKY